MLDYYVYIFKNIFQEFLETCLVMLTKGAHPISIDKFLFWMDSHSEVRFSTDYVLW